MNDIIFVPKDKAKEKNAKNSNKGQSYKKLNLQRQEDAKGAKKLSNISNRTNHIMKACAETKENLKNERTIV